MVDNRKNVKGLFEFLKQLNKISNPIRRNLDNTNLAFSLDTINPFQTINLYTPSDSVYCNDGLIILRIQRPSLTNCPEPPEELTPWLIPGWEKYTDEAKHKDTLSEINEQEETFIDNFYVCNLWDKWIIQREIWRAKEEPARKAYNVFRQFYDMYIEISNNIETIEPVLGLAFFRCDKQNTNYPLIQIKCALIFDPDIPEITVTLKTDASSVNLYSELLYEYDEFNHNEIAKFRDNIMGCGTDIYNQAIYAHILLNSIRALTPESIIDNEGNIIVTIDNSIIRIAFEPTIFLRKRDTGYNEFVEKIIHKIDNGDKIPEGIMSITGIEFENQEKPSLSDSLYKDQHSSDLEVFFTKEANDEQIEIANKINHSNAVIVQGPPGTGKTHTIANLIGDFLARGKRVLVTSHTTKALRVLYDQISEDLQPLCVSVLDDDKRQMENAINGISNRIASSNIDTLQQKEIDYSKRRKEIDIQIEQQKSNLYHAIKGEYDEIIINGESYTPRQAAEYIACYSGYNDIIPGEIQPLLTLSLNEIQALYASNKDLTQMDEKEIQKNLPDLDSFITPSSFYGLVTEYKAINIEDEYSEYWDIKENEECDIEKIKESSKFLIENFRLFESQPQWIKECICDGYLLFYAKNHQDQESITYASTIKEKWDEYFDCFEKAIQIYTKNENIFHKNTLFVDRVITTNQTISTLGDIISYIRQRNKISKISLLLNKDWKQVINKISINGAAPSSLDDYITISEYIKLQITRDELKRISDRIFINDSRISEIMASGSPEIGLLPYKQMINGYLSWFETVISPSFSILRIEGLNWNKLIQKFTYENHRAWKLLLLKDSIISTSLFVKVIEFRTGQCKLESIKAEIDKLKESARLYSETNINIINNMVDAIYTLDTSSYESFYNELKILKSKEKIYRVRLDYLDRLSKSAPQLAQNISKRIDIHGKESMPQNFSEMWKAKLLDQILSQRSRLIVNDILQEISRLEKLQRRVVSSLIESMAWKRQLSRVTRSQRMALEGWRDLERRIGKGTGKRANEFRQLALVKMQECQPAVPVWIMPLYKVYQNCSPENDPFDIIIIDEASQADILALTVVYLGKKIIVVGDDEQVSPIGIGVDSSKMNNLISEYLKNIPNKELYDAQASIYDIARRSYSPIMLKEHFRCVEEIIRFCNDLSYNGTIKPLRDSAKVNHKPPIVPYRVGGSSRNGKVNEIEANSVVALIRACLSHPTYRDSSIGVISLVGNDQSQLIDTKLRSVVTEKEYFEHKILCGNSSQFQGDERDIIFISMVDSPNPDGSPLILRSEGYMNRDKKRYNVAISRAKNQIWIVHSLNYETDLKPGDLRRTLLEYSYTYKSKEEKKRDILNQTESDFESRVACYLFERNYQIIPQWKVGSYRLDLVIKEDDRKVAIECDGEKYHGAENIISDLRRQSILERLGWSFIRIRGSHFYRDPHKAMKEVITRLTEMSINPIVDSSYVESSDNIFPIKDKIIQEANLLLAKEININNTQVSTIKNTIDTDKFDNKINNPFTIKPCGVDNKNISIVAADSACNQNELQGENTSSEKPTTFLEQTTIDELIKKPINLPTTSPDEEESRDRKVKTTLREYLISKSLKVIDNRSSKGSLWVLGGKELTPLFNKLKEKGIIFIYAERGGKATSGKPAWWSTSKR